MMHAYSSAWALEAGQCEPASTPQPASWPVAGSCAGVVLGRRKPGATGGAGGAAAGEQAGQTLHVSAGLTAAGSRAGVVLPPQPGAAAAAGGAVAAEAAPGERAVRADAPCLCRPHGRGGPRRCRSTTATWRGSSSRWRSGCRSGARRTRSGGWRARRRCPRRTPSSSSRRLSPARSTAS